MNKLSVSVCALLLACDSAPRIVEVQPPALEASVAVDADVPEVSPQPPDFSRVLGFYETRYGEGNRGKNIEHAASFFGDGVVVAPGDTLSFNKVVGARDPKNGFLKAPVIIDGELTDGDGGGTCQVSSTLHAAALVSGLTIASRTPHTRPSSYIPLGMDATVVWPDTDLKIENDGKLPVIVAMSTSADPKAKGVHILHVEVRGGIEPPVKPEYTFKVEGTGASFERRTKVPDGGAPPGFIKRAQKGMNGKRVFSTLTFPENHSVIWKSVYPPTDEVWEVSPDWTSEGGMPWEHDAGAPDAARIVDARAD